MTGDNQKLTLGEVSNRFLTNLPSEDKDASQQEIAAFVRWFGSERSLSSVTPPMIDEYAGHLSTSDTDFERKLELVRAFLVCAHKEGWVSSNLSVHLKARKKKKSKILVSRKQSGSEPISLTPQGYADLQVELASLQAKRPQLIEEIRKAAADKDFRENVPLQAAREQRGHLEGRILELEAMLKSAVVIDDNHKNGLTISVGNCVVLTDLTCGQDVRYTLVGPREVDPARGKISTVSPIGRAIMGHGQGETVEVTAPVGKLRFQIKQIER